MTLDFTYTNNPLCVLQTLALQSFDCPSGHFQCGNLTECVHQRFICDDNDDCSNGADEGVANCNIQTYPQGCRCSRKTKVSCEAMNLTEVPTNISASVTALYIVYNQINTLSSGSFEMYPNLVTLSLIANGIEKMERDTFRGCNQLKMLYLSDNRISHIERGTFAHLKNLGWLVLRNNSLVTLTAGMFYGLERLYFLELRQNHIVEDGWESEVFEDMPSLEWLRIQNNQIKSLLPGMFPANTGLKVLVVGRNVIEDIHEDAFNNLQSLQDLDLSSNRIAEIKPNVFRKLRNLTKLNLSNNRRIRTLPVELFSHLTDIRTLNLSGVTIQNIHTDMFKSLARLEHVYFLKFYYCTYASHVYDCSPKSDGISSLENLLANKGLRYFIWIVAASTLIGNLSVLLGRLYLMKSENKVHSLLIKNLCGADLLMGIYLLIIGAHDLNYRDYYYRYSHRWMTSWTCSLCGFLAVTSSETSLLLLTVISVQRFLCIVFPHRMIHFKYKTGVVSVIIVWICALILATVPFTVPSFDNYYGKNGACFPLLITRPFESGWQFSVFMFLGVNTLLFIFILGAYLGMFLSIRITRKATTKDFHLRRKGDMNFAKRFFFIVLTNAMCWVPIFIITTMAFSEIDIPGQVYAWTTVFVIPINSAIDPILYTLTTVPCKQGSVRFFRSRMKRRMRRSGDNRRTCSETTSNAKETIEEVLITVEM
ncbi:uncharacterized protein LOC144439199 [Glandiceps talaboti]